MMTISAHSLLTVTAQQIEETVSKWLVWFLYRLVLVFILPVFLIPLIALINVLIVEFYRIRQLVFNVDELDAWRGARNFIAALWTAQGRIWHGYEVDGFEKIPTTGPAIIIYYHGVGTGIDFYYLALQVIRRKKRLIHVVGDRFLFKVPGMQTFLEVFCVFPGTIISAVELLKQGNLLAIAPGGSREAMYSDEYYKLMWGKRLGFAKIAIEAKVPIIPMFTQNCREPFRYFRTAGYLYRWFYEKTRIAVFNPMCGWFPVKLRTFLGDPIDYDPEVTPEQLSLKVQDAIEELIRKHQRVPGSILYALKDRIYPHQHTA